MGYYKKTERYSYSKLNTFIQCPFKYYLKYVCGNFIDVPGLPMYLGTLIHKIEERIGICIKKGEPINYEELINDFYNYNIPKKDKYDTGGDIFGINILKKRFKEDFYKIDKNGQSYATKTENYAKLGIYRLEEFMKNHPNLEIYSTEHHFEINFHGVILTGSIDRVLRDKETGEFIIEDIKTKDKYFSNEETTTPLQAVIYSLALKSIAGLATEPTTFRYDLPILGDRQPAGTKDFIERGKKKIIKTLDDIHALFTDPHPTPLCYYCEFNKAEMCPYHSVWTPTNKCYAVNYKWISLEKHPEVLEKYKKDCEKNANENFDFDF